MTTARTDNPFRQLPSIDEVLSYPELQDLKSRLPHEVLADCARETVDGWRRQLQDGSRSSVEPAVLAQDVRARAIGYLQPSLRPVINATGIIVHTNLGRSILAQSAVQAVEAVTSGYSTLEYNPKTLSRGSRHDHLESLLCMLTGAEAAVAVNNNAAAVLLVLTEFAAGCEAIVSRGELVEIGGSFRIPDIMKLSGATMVEVGTTNKTHLSDYEDAITPETAMLLKVHPSNYRMIGFTESASVQDLRVLADRENARRDSSPVCQRVTSNDTFSRQAPDGKLPGTPVGDPVKTAPPLLVYEDQGSGAFLHLDCFGSYAEPTVIESVRAGCDLVSFSGDKLLGGAQAGFIVGRADLIARLKKNPLVRALRLDKMTIAALEATLRLYLDPEQALGQIPTLRMLTEPLDAVRDRAVRLAGLIGDRLSAMGREGSLDIDVVSEVAHSGGGALPGCDIDSFVVHLTFNDGDAQGCEHFLANRQGIPVIGRIKRDALLLDVRTIQEPELTEVAYAVAEYAASV